MAMGKYGNKIQKYMLEFYIVKMTNYKLYNYRRNILKTSIGKIWKKMKKKKHVQAVCRKRNHPHFSQHSVG